MDGIRAREGNGSLRQSNLFIPVLFTIGTFLFPGCGDGGNTVIQPSSDEPTAAEIAEYEREQREMEEERD